MVIFFCDQGILKEIAFPLAAGPKIVFTWCKTCQ